MALRNLEREKGLARVLSGVHLAVAIAGAALFLGVVFLLDALSDGFDPLSHTISQHATGEGAPWISAAFVAAGATLFFAGYPARFVLRRRWAKNGLAATFAVGGLCVAGLAFFPTDPPGLHSTTGTIHLFLAVVGISSIMVGALIGSWTFVNEKGWPSGGFFSAALAGGIVGTFVVAAIVAAAKDHPVSAALGLAERVVVFAELGWTILMVARVRQMAMRDGLQIIDNDLHLKGIAMPNADEKKSRTATSAAT